MKKLYFVQTSGYNMVVSVDEENDCRYLTENEEFPYISDDEPENKKRNALEFLESVEDDSSWEDDCTYEQIFEEFPDDIEIIAEIKKEL